ncbi:MAG: tagaturonate epimerase family protein [Candidatus Bathyarchaeia archaeon]
MNVVIDSFRRFYVKGRPLVIYEKSVVQKNECTFFLVREGVEKKLVILSRGSGLHPISSFEVAERGEFRVGDEAYVLAVCPCSHANILALRKILHFLCPQRAGLKAAVGMGDRIGLVTPGHIRAVKAGIFPVFAQQSVRELSRTGRTFDDVLDDVSWAVFQEGYRDEFGADADHLKSIEDVDKAVRAGYTMFTVDPSEYVDNDVERYGLKELEEKFAALPWCNLGCDIKSFQNLYVGKKVTIGKNVFVFTQQSLFKTAVKYSAAIAFTTKVFRYIKTVLGHEDFDFEMSVDETEVPTSLLEHAFIALELRRLNVKVTSLALRFVGRFEKAIDYMGDLEEFDDSFKKHVFIAKAFGPYKISIHSGSDKFTIFPVLGRFASDLIHLKTAGTSYLEALRIVARHEPMLFREIVLFALKRFDEDKKAYDVTTDLSLVPNPNKILDSKLESAYLDDNNGRQLLHITYGSVLTTKKASGEWIYRNRIFRCLMEHEDELYETVAKHLRRHVEAIWS